MITNDEYCGLKFAFDITESHPAFEDEDILYENLDSLDDMDGKLEFAETDYAGAKMTVVFEFDGSPDKFEDAYYIVRDWMNSLYEEDK
jgi:hypothetical protein